MPFLTIVKLISIKEPKVILIKCDFDPFNNKQSYKTDYIIIKRFCEDFQYNLSYNNYSIQFADFEKIKHTYLVFTKVGFFSDFPVLTKKSNNYSSFIQKGTSKENDFTLSESLWNDLDNHYLIGYVAKRIIPGLPCSF